MSRDSLTVRPRIHFTAPAGACHDDILRFGFENGAGFLAFVRRSLDPGYRLTADRRLVQAIERPDQGGRNDDERRIRDLQGALDDPATRAIVAARGGSWFSRIVGKLNFTALARRRPGDPLWAFGFSEITSLVNFVASYPAGRGVYWLCPDYLAWKVAPQSDRTNAAGRAAFAEFWRLLPGIIDPQTPAVGAHLESARGARTPVRAALSAPITGRVVQGRPRPGPIRIIGGCLSVLAATLPGPLSRRLRPDGKWLLIEDIHEAPYRIDRQLAVFTLLGWFQRLAGVLVGDFHSSGDDQQPAAIEVVRRHAPRTLPIVATRSIGHVWPMKPVLLNRPVRIAVAGSRLRIAAPLLNPDQPTFRTRP